MAIDPITQPLKLSKTMPVGPLRGTVIFPGNPVPIISGRIKSKLALDAGWSTNRLIVFVTQKNERLDEPGPNDLYKVGTVCLIKRIIKVDNDYQVSAEGLSRVFIKEYTQTEPYFEAAIEEIPEFSTKNDENEAMLRTVKEQLRKYLELGGNALFDPSGFANWSLLSANDDPNTLVNSICQMIEFKTIDKQHILEMVSALERMQRVSDLLAKEIRILEISQKISSHTQERVSRMTKEAILREQMRSIEEELGDGENGNQEVREFELKIRKAGMPKEVREKATKELSRLAKMSSYNPEAGYIRNYLEWLTDVPWKSGSSGKVNMKRAQQILDEDHYGLKKVKERVLEYLAVYKLAGKMNGPILCFVGAPGVGKTSIGKSIARALGRKFVKVSLGGIHDEAEIRGHRRTYVGSMPGRIIQSIKTVGTANPVFMLDELDKLGADYRGDPSAALLEALDPEQNRAFSDHYLEVPYDLSNVMFVTTANILDTIPPALRDRLEVIPYPGYTHEEKFHIAKKYLIPKVTKSHGIKDGQIEFEDKAVYFIIESYTREAGVRGLERELSGIIRKVARQIAEGEKKKSFKITEEEVKKRLGPVKFIPQLAEIEDMVGASTGLAVMESIGGDVLFIEVTIMPGKGAVQITGQLGDVMKESAQAAMSYVRTNWAGLGIPEKMAQKVDVHIHVPEGGVPKDGPSAGIAMTTAIVSAFTKVPVRKDVAMTGEVTLRGRVLEIGGLKEKVLAAHRAGVKTVIAPENNRKDLEDIPQYVLEDLEFHFVKHIDEVLEIALIRPPVSSKKEHIPHTPQPALA